MGFKVQFVDSIKAVAPSLMRSSQPFLRREFWQALEDCGAVSAHAGWLARHVLLLDDDVPVACLPLFVKNHHRGEYVFDHAWAQAYAAQGLDYYPRLVSCVPFSPVVGERVWLADGVALADVWPHLLQGVRHLAREVGASSWHGLFWDEASLSVVRHNVAVRTGCQFLWVDAGYVDFAGFLATLTAKRRKMINAERRKVTQAGVTCAWLEGASISTDDWAFFYRCYERTYQVRGQTPYLPLAFFEQLGRTMATQLVLQIASRGGERIAAALFFKDANTLYGRYWGALAQVDCLHFEVCYYQGLEYALAHNMRFFDPGTQGEHKLLRGFAPIYTHSTHWLAEPRFMAAVQDFVAREQVGVAEYFAQAQACLPFSSTQKGT
ncbi:MAG: GNAT family N-acetyltransferase [Formosimonas sp.]